MNNHKYIQILQFLETYGGEKYKKIEKCKSEEEKAYMLEGAENGKNARASFEEIVREIGSKCRLEVQKVTQWQNSGNFVRYFWCQLKDSDYLESNISLSVFAESTSEALRFRVSVELAVEKSSNDEKEAYKKLLNLPLKTGLVYISGGNNEDEFRVLEEFDNNKVKKLNLKKVQVSYLVNKEDYDNDRDILRSLVKGATNLIEYYNYALNNDDVDNTTQESISDTSSEEVTSSIHEYNPNISTTKWLELLPEIIDRGWGDLLAMLYTAKDGTTCSDLADMFNRKSMEISGRCTQLAKWVYKETNCSLINKGDKIRYWFILFSRKDASAEEKGTFVWKLRPELYDALTEFDILRFLPKIETDKGDEPEFNITQKEAMAQIKNFIASRGFSYPGNLIENFYLSLKSKPFTILAGTSGTGKTRLVKLFAEAIHAHYKMVPVRPDWSDSSDLFGHVDLNGQFVPGAVLEFIADAQAHPGLPYILCLDEMNLARVEYYLSDFLSVIETREIADGKIVSDLLVTAEKYGMDTVAMSKYGEIRFPQNLYLIGTVNMDETTFSFSKKVLDRANTIEFDYVDLSSIQNTDGKKADFITAPNSFLETSYLFLKQCMDEDPDYVKDVCDALQKINAVLQKANAHVGYRVRDEIVFYLMNNKKAGLLSEDEALDNEIMQKILPRIQGSSVSMKDMLCELFKILAGDYEGYQTKNNDVAMKMKDKLKGVNVKYPKSARKVAFMVRRFEEDGFTSYWL